MPLFGVFFIIECMFLLFYGASLLLRGDQKYSNYSIQSGYQVAYRSDSQIPADQYNQPQKPISQSEKLLHYNIVLAFVLLPLLSILLCIYIASERYFYTYQLSFWTSLLPISFVVLPIYWLLIFRRRMNLRIKNNFLCYFIILLIAGTSPILSLWVTPIIFNLLACLPFISAINNLYILVWYSLVFIYSLFFSIKQKLQRWLIALYAVL